MKYVDTLGQSLKSDFLNDLFETYEVTVSYEYDRSNENMEDQYHAEIPEMGLQFLFDATQKLTCIFMKPVNHSGYNPFASVSLPRERLWDIRVPKIDSPTRQPISAPAVPVTGPAPGHRYARPRLRRRLPR